MSPTQLFKLLIQFLCKQYTFNLKLNLLGTYLLTYQHNFWGISKYFYLIKKMQLVGLQEKKFFGGHPTASWAFTGQW